MTVRAVKSDEAPRTGSALAARGLGYRVAGGVSLVTGIDLSIQAAECLAIVGPNGAGKTTLLRLLSGRLTPSEGMVTLDGAGLRSLRPLERALRIAVLVQRENSDPRLTVREYVALGRIPHHGKVGADTHAAAIARAIEQCGLDGLAARTLVSLSGGERQRAGIARALAQEPSVLFLDEPTNNLDPRARSDLLDLARGLGITVVAVLHDLPLVAPFSDRVAVMMGGRLVAHDTPDAALTPSVVSEVFRLDVVSVAHPRDGRKLMFFEAPASNTNTLDRIKGGLRS